MKFQVHANQDISQSPSDLDLEIKFDSFVTRNFNAENLKSSLKDFGVSYEKD